MTCILRKSFLPTFALLIPGLSASAQVVVHDNFGPGDTFYLNSGLADIGPASGFGYNSQGMGFVPTLSGTLDTLTVAISSQEGTNDAHLFLSDGTSGTPGTTLETFTLTNLLTFGFPFTPQILTSVLHPMLNAGTTYYLYGNEPGDEEVTWNQNVMGEMGVIGSTNGSSYISKPTALTGAYRVTVFACPVPEPDRIALLIGLGIVFLSIPRRLNRT